jgi:hypothetical protein
MNNYIKALIFIIICLAFLIPFASSNPDGLERVAEDLGIEETHSSSTGLMPDYTVPIVKNDYGSTLIAGIIGVFLVLGVTFVFGKTLTKTN